MTDSNRSYTGSETEAELGSLPPTPTNGSLAERKLWAYRCYYGIGEDGKRVDEMTQRDIGDILDIDPRTVRRWLNNPPTIKDLSQSERQAVFLFCVTGNDFRPYLDRVRSDHDPEPDSEPGPFGDLDPEFNPW